MLKKIKKIKEVSGGLKQQEEQSTSDTRGMRWTVSAFTIQTKRCVLNSQYMCVCPRVFVRPWPGEGRNGAKYGRSQREDKNVRIGASGRC